MGWKTFDYSCMNEKCVNYRVKVERMVKDSEKDSQVCEYCKSILIKGFSVSAIKTGDNQGRVKI